MEHATGQYDAASRKYLGAGKASGRRGGDKLDRARVDMHQAEVRPHAVCYGPSMPSQVVLVTMAMATESLHSI